MSSAAKSDPLHLQGLGQHLLHKAATEIFVQMNINVEVRRWGGAGRGGEENITAVIKRRYSTSVSTMVIGDFGGKAVE